jgi:hypothetical protein
MIQAFLRTPQKTKNALHLATTFAISYATFKRILKKYRTEGYCWNTRAAKGGRKLKLGISEMNVKFLNRSLITKYPLNKHTPKRDDSVHKTSALLIQSLLSIAHISITSSGLHIILG